MNECRNNRIQPRHFGRRVLSVLLCLAMLLSLGNGMPLRRVSYADGPELSCSYTTPTGVGYAGYTVHVHTDACYADGKLVCPLPEIAAHVHSEACYTTESVLICGQEEAEAHTHDESCYGPVRGELTCALEELAGHTHSADCYTRIPGDLICGLDEGEEHQHTEDCYAWTEELTCGLEESEGHVHSDECYAWDEGLVCGLEETEGHTHTEACFETHTELTCGQQELHTHNESCYDAEGNLTCGLLQLEEHVHGEECFRTKQASEPEREEGDPGADLESEAVYAAAFADLDLTGAWDEALLAVAMTQLGYRESERNFIYDEHNQKQNYTRYGAWYGIAYGDWCAMFVSFCLHYAGIPEEAMPIDSGVIHWIEQLEEAGLYAPAGEYAPKPGDLIFFDFDFDNHSDHMGIVTKLDETTVQTIEGNRLPKVALFTYDIDDPTILGYGLLPERPEEDPDTELAVITTAEGTELPTEASVRALVLEGEAADQALALVEDYRAAQETAWNAIRKKAKLAAQTPASSETAETRYVALEIGIEDLDAADYAEDFSVSVTLPNAVRGKDFHLYHIHDGAVTEISGEDLTLDMTVIDEENGTQTLSGFSFKTDSFSPFVLSYTVDFYYGEYEYHLPGEGEMMLSELFALLNIEESVSDVVSVDFSAPALLAVEPLADDWKLVSLQAFDTEETLTVTLSNGDAITVKVTDAAQKKTITFSVSPSGWAAVRRDSTYNSTSSFELTNTNTSVIIMNPSMGTAYRSSWNVSNTTRFDYLFATWTIDGHLYNKLVTGNSNCDLAVNPYTDDDVADGSTLTAHFYPKSATVVLFDTEDGTSAQGTVSSNVYFFGSSEDGNSANVLPTANPTAGYLFEGWYDGDTLVSNKASISQAELSNLASGTVLKARFYKPATISYATKAFSGNNGSGSVSLNGQNKYASSKNEVVPLYTDAIGATAKANSGSRFLYWEDASGNIVSTDSGFTPKGDQIYDGATYTAVFTNQAGVILTINDHAIAKVSSSNTGSNDITGVRQNPGRDATYYLYDNNGNRVSTSPTVEFVRWEIKNDSSPEVEISTEPNFRYINGTVYGSVHAVVKPKNTFIVNYDSTSGGSINNTTDYAGSTTAKGATATANTGDGYYFLGWYIGDRRVWTNKTITAQDLIDWKNAGYISEDFTTITARFGPGVLIRYEEDIDGTKSELVSERVTTELPAGYTAPTKEGYNFVGWYKGSQLVSQDAELSYVEMGNITEDVTFTAKYEKAYTATYTVENVDGIVENEEVISRYGEIALGSVRTYDSTVQTTAPGGVLTRSATAVPVPGCAFTGWTVTDKAGNPVSIPGFDSDAATLPSNLTISEDVVFTARFEKLDSSLEIVYNIQQDVDKQVYAASLTVDGRTVYGTADQSAFISEIVPQNGSAKGCSAQGTVINGNQYDITGWVLGKNNEPDKDKLFTLYSTFVPSGEYLQDVNGTGVRYFRVVPKWEQNVYVQTKVSDPEGGDFYLGSNEIYTEKLIFINNRTRTEEDLNKGLDGGRADNFRTEMRRYTIKVNSGYKLVGFSFNNNELILKTPITDNNNHNLSAEDLKLKEPITLISKIEKDDNGGPKTVTVDNLLDYGYHTAIFREVDGTVERSLNILVANFEKLDSFNIQYHVLSGSGEVSNTSDNFTETDRTAWVSDKETAYPISGSTAIADVDNDYVFDHWEWDDETGAKDSETGEALRQTSTKAYLIPDITKLTDPNTTYHYYAVFVQKPKVNIIYVPDDPDHGLTSPEKESVYQGDLATGSTATPFDGWKFLYWTREGSNEILSTDPGFVPQVYNGEERSGDHILSTDFTSPASTVTFIAHFAEDNTGSITVHKTVIPQNGLTLSDLEDLTIYFALTKDGKQQDYLTKDRRVWTESITLTAEDIDTEGNVNAVATFSNLPDGNYEVWELAEINGNLVKQYIGMLVTDNVQISKISASNDSDAGGNNAILSGEDNQKNVYFKNTYSPPKDTTVFEVTKEWQDSEKTPLTGSSIPTGAQVEITVYQEIDGETKAFRSILLDGIPDVDGEDRQWHARFENLPRTTEEGKEIKYKVRETVEWPGYEPYINSGRTYLYENLYMENSGGTIINRALETDEVLVTVRKVDKTDGVTPLTGTSFRLEKKNGSAWTPFTDDQADGVYTVSAEDLDKGTFTASLSDGEYRLLEVVAPSGYYMLTDAVSFRIENGELKADGENAEDYVEIDTDTMIITVKNAPGVELPMTGGMGTALFTGGGALLILAAGALLFLRRRKKA